MATTQNTYTGDGTTVLFSFNFPYLKTTDIKVSLGGSITTAYTLANAQQIQFNTAPGSGVAIRIYRETDDTDLDAEFYPGSAIRSQDLNDNFDKVLYIAQETKNLTVQASTGNLADGSITGNLIANGAVTTAKIADSSITTAKVADSSITSNLIANGAVTTTKISDSNVTTVKLADGSVTTAKLADNSVTTAKIADGNVNEAKLADLNTLTFSTNSSTTNVDGDVMGTLLFKGYDGSVFRTGASIVANVDDPTAGSVSGDLVFSVTESGDTTPTPRYRIDLYGTHSITGKNSVLFSSSEAAAGTTYATFVGRHSATTINNGTVSCFIYNNGDIYNTNNVYSVISDASLKENIVDASSQWSDVKDLQVRNFNFKASTGHQTDTQIGFIAQEVEQVSPGLVEEINTGDTTIKGVKTSVLLVKAVKALQEAMDRIEQLEATQTNLIAQINSITTN